MTTYLMVFIISLFFIYIAEKDEKLKVFRLSKILYLIGVLLPVILAGCRAFSVGTDVMVYGVPRFNMALQFNNINEYLNANQMAILSEPLYNIFNYIISRFTTDPHWILFFIALLINGFVFAGCYKFKDIVPIWFGMALFYFTFFNLSLNLMRQSIAMAILFFATHYIFLEKKLKYYFWNVIAIGFHSTAILGLIFYPLYFYIKKKKEKKKFRSWIFNISIFIVAIIFIIILQNIIPILVEKGILRENYLNYLNGKAFGSGFSIKAFLLSLSELLFILVFSKKIRNKYESGDYLIALAIIGFVFNQLSFISTFIIRIAYYFLFIRMYLYAIIPYLYKNKKNRCLFLTVTLIYFTWYWIYNYVILGYHETIPYISNLLKFS